MCSGCAELHRFYVLTADPQGLIGSKILNKVGGGGGILIDQTDGEAVGNWCKLAMDAIIIHITCHISYVFGNKTILSINCIIKRSCLGVKFSSAVLYYHPSSILVKNEHEEGPYPQN